MDVVEEMITSEWCALLCRPTAKPADEFFAEGGNSLLAVALIERVERRLGIAFPAEVLFLDGRLGAVIDSCRQLSEARPGPAQ